MAIHDPPSSLGGFRVLELASPRVQYAGKLCADMGADVVKVERPGGDVARQVGPFADDIPDRNRSLYFWHYNTSKRGITLDIESAEGQDLLRRLIASADVLLEGCDPGYLTSLGLEIESLQKSNPRLIVGSITEFGRNGPWRDWKGGDLVQMALSGVMAVTGYDSPTVAPIASGIYQTIHTGCHYLYIGVLAALLERTRSGQGQSVQVAIHDCMSTVTENHLPSWIYKKELQVRNTARRPKRQYRGKDGGYVNLIMPNVDATLWQTIVSWLESEGMAGDLTDAKYLDPFYRAEKWDHWTSVVGKFIEAHDSELIYHGAQMRHITWSAIRAPEEPLGDLHLQDRRFWASAEHPEEGKTYIYPGAPYPMPESPWRIRCRAPLVGEHNFEVYCRELGLTRQQLTALAENGIV